MAMMKSFRMSPKLVVLAFALLMVHQAASFHVGLGRSAMLSPIPPSSLNRQRAAHVINDNKRRSALTVRGGATRANPLHSFAVEAISIVNSFYQTSPFLAAAVTCGSKACAADYVAQRRQSSNDLSSKLDTARNIAFVLYGALYQGMAQEYIYNHCYPVWFGAGTSAGIVLKKVLFDLLIQTTLFTLPIAYLTKAAIFRQSAKEGLKRYWHDVVENGLLTKYFLLWGPVQCLTFSLVPEHLRVSFIAAVSFFWLIILSSVSARPAGSNKAGTPSSVSSTVTAKEQKKRGKTLVDA